MDTETHSWIIKKVMRVYRIKLTWIHIINLPCMFQGAKVAIEAIVGYGKQAVLHTYGLNFTK